MKIEKKDIPEAMKNTIVGVSPKTKEQDSTDILKGIWAEENSRRKDNRRATLFVNLVFLMCLGLFVAMSIYGSLLYALPALTLVTLGALVFNIFIFNESKRTKRNQEAITKFVPIHYESR